MGVENGREVWVDAPQVHDGEGLVLSQGSQDMGKADHGCRHNLCLDGFGRLLQIINLIGVARALCESLMPM